MMGTKYRRGTGKYGTPKSVRICVGLTEDGAEGLREIAAEFNLSISELVEQIGRRLILCARQESAALPSSTDESVAD